MGWMLVTVAKMSEPVASIAPVLPGVGMRSAVYRVSVLRHRICIRSSKVGSTSCPTASTTKKGMA